MMVVSSLFLIMMIDMIIVFGGFFDLKPSKNPPKRGTESAVPKPERYSTFAEISVSHAILNPFVKCVF